MMNKQLILWKKIITELKAFNYEHDLELGYLLTGGELRVYGEIIELGFKELHLKEAEAEEEEVIFTEKLKKADYKKLTLLLVLMLEKTRSNKRKLQARLDELEGY